MYPVKSLCQYRNILVILAINKLVICNQVFSGLTNKRRNFNRLVEPKFIILFQNVVNIRFCNKNLAGTVNPGLAINSKEKISFNGAFLLQRPDGRPGLWC